MKRTGLMNHTSQMSQMTRREIRWGPATQPRLHLLQAQGALGALVVRVALIKTTS